MADDHQKTDALENREAQEKCTILMRHETKKPNLNFVMMTASSHEEIYKTYRMKLVKGESILKQSLSLKSCPEECGSNTTQIGSFTFNLKRIKRNALMYGAWARSVHIFIIQLYNFNFNFPHFSSNFIVFVSPKYCIVPTTPSFMLISFIGWCRVRWIDMLLLPRFVPPRL